MIVKGRFESGFQVVQIKREGREDAKASVASALLGITSLGGRLLEK